MMALLGVIRRLYYIVSPIPILLVIIAHFRMNSEAVYPRLPGIGLLICALYASLSLGLVGIVLAIASGFKRLRLLPVMTATFFALLPSIYLFTGIYVQHSIDKFYFEEHRVR
jgi:hypothetical protein